MLEWVDEQLHFLLICKPPYALYAEFDLFFLKRHIGATPRIKEFGAGNLKAAHIKISGGYRKLDRLLLDSDLQIGLIVIVIAIDAF